jgi:L-2-aminoadipate reductase
MQTVECAGRADDQVKIRGFRIELGEIDTYLTQHPLVRENVTLVRRDKDEEPTLVSYFVPKQSTELDELLSDDGDGYDLSDDELVKGLRKYRKLIRQVREHLKSKLPSYAVPTGYFFHKSRPDVESSICTSYENASKPKWEGR